MILTEIALKRPVLTIMSMLSLLVVGIFSFNKLAVDELPNVEFPISIVTVQYPGASPEVIETEVAKKIEEAINPLQGIKEITSNITEGLVNIFIEFQLGRDPDIAAQDIRDVLSRIKGALPEDINEPLIQNYDPSAQPILTMGLASTTLSLGELSSIAKENLKKQFERIDGVGQVRIYGNLERQVNVNLNLQRLYEKQVNIQAILESIRKNNQERPVGVLKNKNISTQLRIKGKINKVSKFQNILIKDLNNKKVYLSEISNIEDGFAEPTSKGYLNKQPIIIMDINKIRGTNTAQISEKALALMHTINTSQLVDIGKLSVLKDNAQDIKDSLHELMFALSLGTVLTIFIVFVFLNSWRSTIITGVTVPISLISTFILINMLGYSLNTMTLLALSLAVGLVIDDAIVVRENIVRKLDLGLDHWTAALEGTKQVGLPVLAATGSIMAVFIPIAFMGGLTGQFFREFGVTVSFAVLISLIVSFTLDPVLSNIWHDERKTTGLLYKFDKAFDKFANYYSNLLRKALRHPIFVSLGVLLLFVGSLSLVPLIGGGFLPEQDKGKIQVMVRAPINMTLEYTESRTAIVRDALQHKFGQYIDYIYIKTGGGFEQLDNESFLYIQLKDKTIYKRPSQFELMAKMRQSLKSLAGMEVFISPADQGGAPGSPLQISVQGDNYKILQSLAQQIYTIAQNIEGTADLLISDEVDRNSLNIYINYQRANDLGIDQESVITVLNTLYTGSVASYWEAPDGEELDVIVRLPESQRISDQTLNQIYIANKENKLIPLNSIIKLQSAYELNRLRRRNLQKEILITGQTENKSIAHVTEALNTQIQSEIKFPPGYQIKYVGESADMDEAIQYSLEALFLAVFFIYFVMSSQFNSYIQPLSIMLTLPLALIGVLIALFITGTTLNIMSMIGVITLMGLVTKNGILLIEFANQVRQDDLTISIHESLVSAAKVRLKPIIMTSLASACGVLPLALEWGSGAELRAPMARAILGGLISSSILTLFIIPVAYSVLENMKIYFSRKNSYQRYKI